MLWVQVRCPQTNKQETGDRPGSRGGPTRGGPPKKVKSNIAKTIEEKRIASNIEVNIPTSDLETMDFESQNVNFEILSQQIEQDETPAKAG